MDRPERATIQMFLFCSRSSTFVVLKNEIYFVDLDRMPSKRKRSACCFERGSAPRLCQLAKNVLYKILRSSIFTSSRGRRSMASTHSDTHATAPQPPNPQTTNFQFISPLCTFGRRRSSRCSRCRRCLACCTCQGCRPEQN